MRPRKDISAYEGDIRAWQHDGLTREEMLRLLRTLHGVDISLASFKQRVTDMGGVTTARRPPLDDTPALRAAIEETFRAGLTEPQMVEALRAKGFDLSQRALGRQRRRMGLMKRATPGKEAVVERELLEILEKEIGDGQMGEVGRKGLYKRIRANYNFVGRDRIFRLAREKFPDAVKPPRNNPGLGRRALRLQRQQAMASGQSTAGPSTMRPSAPQRRPAPPPPAQLAITPTYTIASTQPAPLHPYTALPEHASTNQPYPNLPVHADAFPAYAEMPAYPSAAPTYPSPPEQSGTAPASPDQPAYASTVPAYAEPPNLQSWRERVNLLLDPRLRA
ncbi:hypothetical protein LTR53_005569 [Teratosphaeriaceae sp. CCFEE 6253]|nr:hypothetical protein LTR53_005569 [Teratosphaeriaceae sp. CCFEE 6253]